MLDVKSDYPKSVDTRIRVNLEGALQAVSEEVDHNQMALSEADRVDSAEIRSEVKRGVQNAVLRMAARLAVNATVETTHEDAQDDVWASMEELESIDQLFKELEEADKTCQSFKNLVAVIDVDGRDEPLVIEATRDPGYESWTYPDISGWGDPGPMPKHGPSELISNKAQAQADRQSDYLPIPLQVGGFWPKLYK